MLHFKKLELEDVPSLRPCYEADRDTECRICDATPGTAAMWRRVFDVSFCREGNTLLFSVVTPDGTPAFSYPIGDDPEGMLEKLRAHCAETGRTPVFYLVAASKLEPLRRIFGSADAVTNRDDSDYLYESEALVRLAGRKYSAQRNHIHRFMNENPDWTFEPITQANKSRVMDYFARYKATVHKDSDLFSEEERIIDEIFAHYETYGMFGGMLTAGGDVAGFSIGEIYRDTLHVHVEKGNVAYTGVYQMLSHKFAETFAGAGVSYINREDDMGDDGLRQSKLSYHPSALLEKYTVTVK